MDHDKLLISKSRKHDLVLSYGVSSGGYVDIHPLHEGVETPAHSVRMHFSAGRFVTCVEHGARPPQPMTGNPLFPDEPHPQAQQNLVRWAKETQQRVVQGEHIDLDDALKAMSEHSGDRGLDSLVIKSIHNLHNAGPYRPFS